MPSTAEEQNSTPMLSCWPSAAAWRGSRRSRSSTYWSRSKRTHADEEHGQADVRVQAEQEPTSRRVMALGRGVERALRTKWWVKLEGRFCPRVAQPSKAPGSACALPEIGFGRAIATAHLSPALPKYWRRPRWRRPAASGEQRIQGCAPSRPGIRAPIARGLADANSSTTPRWSGSSCASRLRRSFVGLPVDQRRLIARAAVDVLEQGMRPAAAVAGDDVALLGRTGPSRQICCTSARSSAMRAAANSPDCSGVDQRGHLRAQPGVGIATRRASARSVRRMLASSLNIWAFRPRPDGMVCGLPKMLTSEALSEQPLPNESRSRRARRRRSRRIRGASGRDHEPVFVAGRWAMTWYVLPPHRQPCLLEHRIAVLVSLSAGRCRRAWPACGFERALMGPVSRRGSMPPWYCTERSCDIVRFAVHAPRGRRWPPR